MAVFVNSLRFLHTHADTTRADKQAQILIYSLRVIIHALQEFAQVCKSRISKGVSLPCHAPCCTVMRSRWCQIGVNAPL
jgi:hypothetical protein